MRQLIAIGLLFFVAAGCARKKPLPLVVMPQTATGAGGTAAARWSVPGFNDAANPVYQGRTPPQWAEQLHSADPAVRSQASRALASMGETGYPHLRDGMRKGPVEARLACIGAIGKDTLVAHKSETLPLLAGMLSDAEPALRRSAAARICWFGADARSVLPELQRVAEKDDDPDARAAARVSIDVIENPNGLPKEAPSQDN